MEEINLTQDIKVFGLQVKTFPAGIGEAFDSLIKMLPGGFDRSFYGISTGDESGNIFYYATAEETFPGEAEKYNCQTYTIEKGEYLGEKINGWRDKTGCIKDVFMAMMKDDRVNKTKPCIEWYKNDDVMFCLVKHA